VRASRYAAITPSGSFHGSNRDTWVTSGASRRTPIQSSTCRAVTRVRGRFFGLSGSIAGGAIATRAIGRSGGTNSRSVKTAAS
jgi:hypothetical protein